MSTALDLHALTRLEGVAVVADVLGITPRALVDMRRGATPITVDELHAICLRWPAFDVVATVRRIGQIRDVYGKSKRIRRAVEVPKVGTFPVCGETGAAR